VWLAHTSAQPAGLPAKTTVLKLSGAIWLLISLLHYTSYSVFYKNSIDFFHRRRTCHLPQTPPVSPHSFAPIYRRPTFLHRPKPPCIALPWPYVRFYRMAPLKMLHY